MRRVITAALLVLGFAWPASAGVDRGTETSNVRDTDGVATEFVRLAQADTLVITAPGRIDIDQDTVDFTGKVEAAGEVTLTVNGMPVTVAADGSFRVRQQVPVGRTRLRLVAEDTRGRKAEQRVFVRRAMAPGETGDFGSYHALVIGNNDYEHLSDLQMAVADAEAVAALLTERYGFDVEILIDATRYDIISALTRKRAELTEHDNLLIYYAGHGNLDVESDEGYWLPVDAEPDNPANWVSNNMITGQLRAIRAKHVLVVADSCYSGKLTRNIETNLRTGAERSAWLKRMNARRSRTALTSGGLEPVVDAGGGLHSVFARAFLDALRTNDEILDGQSLFDAIKRPVVVNADQTPEYADVRRAGHNGGDFLFVPISATPSATLATPWEPVSSPPDDTAATERLFWESIKESKNPKAFGLYLFQYPNGAFTRLAWLKLEELKEDSQSPKILVKEAQRLLAILGYQVGSADGIAGPETIGAVEAFQKQAGLKPDGWINENLIRSMRAGAEAKRKAEEERQRAEEARKAEEARLAEEARNAEEKRLAEEARIAEEKRLAEDARIAEEARLAEDARIAEEARLAEEIRIAEEERIAEEKRIAEEARLAEEARNAEEKRLAEEARIAEEKRLAEEARLAEEVKLAEERRIAEEEARRLAEEEARLADEKRKREEEERLAEERRKAEEARIAEERRLAEERRKAEEARLAEERLKAEEAARLAAALEEEERLAEQKRLEEERLRAEEEAKRLAEERRLEEERIAAEEVRLAEERRKAEEEARRRAEEEARLAEEKRKREEEERLAEERRKALEAKIAEEKRLAEEARQAMEARLAEERRKAEEARIAEEKRLAEERRKALEARIAEEARLAEERRIAEEERKFEEARIAEERRKAEEAHIAEDARIAEEKRLAEERRIAEEERKVEEARLAEERRKAEDARIAEEARKVEEARKAEEARIAEERRRAEEAREADDERQRAEAEEEAGKRAEATQIAMVTPTSILHKWCGETVTLILTPTSWTFRLSDGYETTFKIQRYRVLEDAIWIYWADFDNRAMVTEFGEFTNDRRNMVQVRGRFEPDGEWNPYNRSFVRC